MTDQGTVEALRSSEVAAAIRRERLIVVLRRVAPQERLIALVRELADAGARVFEVTFDAPTAADDLVACRTALRDRAVDGSSLARARSEPRTPSTPRSLPVPTLA
jgi:hypothetical protein